MSNTNFSFRFSVAAAPNSPVGIMAWWSVIFLSLNTLLLFRKVFCANKGAVRSAYGLSPRNIPGTLG